MNPIAAAIITAISAISTTKQNAAQGRLAAYRESQLKAQDDLKFARDKELIKLNKSYSSKSSSSDKSRDYQAQILVDQHKLNNELSNFEIGQKKYPSLANIQGDSQNKATLLYAMRNNKNVPFHILKQAEHTYNLLMNDPDFNSLDTINAWNDLARLEPQLMQSINIPISSNTPTVISTESATPVEEYNPHSVESRAPWLKDQRKDKKNIWQTISSSFSSKKATTSNSERHRKIIEEEYQKSNPIITMEDTLAGGKKQFEETQLQKDLQKKIEIEKQFPSLREYQNPPLILPINDFNIDDKHTRDINR